jgi:hypothetical protein
MELLERPVDLDDDREVIFDGLQVRPGDGEVADPPASDYIVARRRRTSALACRFPTRRFDSKEEGPEAYRRIARPPVRGSARSDDYTANIHLATS